MTKKKDSEFLRGYKIGVKDGSFAGYKLAVVCMFMILKDKHDASDDDMMQLWRELDDYTQNVHHKNMNYKDMETVLTDEYGFEFKWI